MRQQRREQLLDVTKEQVRIVAQEYIVDALEEGKERMAFLGEKRPWVDGSWETRDMGILQQDPEILDEDDVKEAALGS